MLAAVVEQFRLDLVRPLTLLPIEGEIAPHTASFELLCPCAVLAGWIADSPAFSALHT